jgi:hypothetical protein
MYSANIMQTLDARPTLQTVRPLYQKALLRGKLQMLIAAVTGRSNRLGGIDELGAAPTTSQRGLGARVVRIADIRASENRSGEFDSDFNPLKTHTRERWLSIAAARLNGIIMPAVELIQVGDVYAVRDGHHRISVARALGAEYIDARITS